MRYPSLTDIRSLAKKPNQSKAVSIFLPTHRISLPYNLRVDRIRMKNAINDVEAELSKTIDKKDIRSYTDKLRRIHSDESFWRYRDNGLAIFIKKDGVTYYDLPLEIEYRVHVGDYFVITPLLAVMRNNYVYMVLELNQKHPRFFIASQAGIDQVLDSKLPGSIDTALKIDEYEKNLQHRPKSNNSNMGVYHGRGGYSENDFHALERYLRIVDKVLWESILHKSNRPLVLLGASRSASLYKKLSRYANICERTVSGNYESIDKKIIHQLSWEIIVGEIEAESSRLARMMLGAKYRDEAQILTSNKRISKAAKEGRISTLLLNVVTKTYDSVVKKVEQRYKVDLPANSRVLKNIEATARDVLRTGGDIQPVAHIENNGHHEEYLQAITR